MIGGVETIQLIGPTGNAVVCHVNQLRDDGVIREMTFNCEELGRKRYGAADFFACLCEFRREIEPRGWRVACNGARRDAWPSGMARDMGSGLKVYRLRRKPLGPADLLETFGPAPADECVALTEQVEFASKFFNYAVG